MEGCLVDGCPCVDFTQHAFIKNKCNECFHKADQHAIKKVPNRPPPPRPGGGGGVVESLNLRSIQQPSFSPPSVVSPSNPAFVTEFTKKQTHVARLSLVGERALASAAGAGSGAGTGAGNEAMGGDLDGAQGQLHGEVRHEGGEEVGAPAISFAPRSRAQSAVAQVVVVEEPAADDSKQAVEHEVVVEARQPSPAPTPDPAPTEQPEDPRPLASPPPQQQPPQPSPPPPHPSQQQAIVFPPAASRVTVEAMEDDGDTGSDDASSGLDEAKPMRPVFVAVDRLPPGRASITVPNHLPAPGSGGAARARSGTISVIQFQERKPAAATPLDAFLQTHTSYSRASIVDRDIGDVLADDDGAATSPVLPPPPPPLVDDAAAAPPAEAEETAQDPGAEVDPALFRSLPSPQVAEGPVGAARERALTASGMSPAEKRKTRELWLKRDKIEKEIVSSEAAYVAMLQLVVERFLLPLEQSVEQEKHGILQLSSVKAIFGNVEQILVVNSSFLSTLHSGCTVGSSFLKIVPQLEVYSHFVNNFERSLTVLSQAKTVKRFEAFLAKAMEDGESKGLDLSSLLIMPVQRIPRYELLLKELIKATPETHLESPLLREALAAVSVTARMINETKDAVDNLNKILCIQSRFTLLDEPLATPGRRILRAGKLSKMPSSKAGMERRRHFFLFNDVLIYASRNRSDMYEMKGQISLTSASIREVAGDNNAFEIISKRGSFRIIAESPEMKKAWVDDLRFAVQYTQQSLLRQVTGEVMDGIALRMKTVTVDPKYLTHVEEIASFQTKM